ncbi:hypothetical protein F5Y13DRAFT_191268 [Hypoxylon sp. FL1857]|nr:hypothetical protein F5Y13DRAFT_191268 [Hypoxylon sp. FL1857]
MEARTLRPRKDGVVGSSVAAASANPKKRKTRHARKGRKKRPRLQIDIIEEEQHEDEEDEEGEEDEEDEGEEGAQGAEDSDDERIERFVPLNLLNFKVVSSRVLIRYRFSSGRAKKGKKGQGRNSVHWARHRNALLKDFNKVPGTPLGTASRGPSNLLKSASSTQKWFEEDCPPVTIEALIERLPDPQREIDDIWTQEREEELLSKYPEDDTYRVYVESSEENLTTNYWSMYRKICRIRGVFPEDIVGERTMLQYAEEVQIGPRDWRPNPNWTKNFCKRLEQLAISSPCQENMDLLALFIRYVVACQLNDRRVVPMDNSNTGQMFFELMTTVMKEARGSKSLQEVGEDARSRWTSKGWKLPWEAKVLRGIESVAYNDEARPIIEGEVLRPYQVNTEDLEDLIFVFESMADTGYPVHNMDERQSVVSYARSAKDAPGDIGELGKLRWPLILSGIRFREKKRLIGEQGGQGGSVLDDHANLLGRGIIVDGLSRDPSPANELRSGGGSSQAGGGEDFGFDDDDDDEEEEEDQQQQQQQQQQQEEEDEEEDGDDDDDDEDMGDEEDLRTNCFW